MGQDRSQEQSNIPGLTNEQRWKIRDYSKDRYPSDPQNTREAITREIKGIRKERDEVKTKEQASAKKRGELIDTRNMVISQRDTVAERLVTAEAELRNRETSLALRVVDFFTRGKKKQELEQQIASLPEEARSTEQQAESLSNELVQLDEATRRIMLQREGLRDDRAVLERFYKAWGRDLKVKESRDELEEYKMTEGRLERVVERYDCYIVHGTTPYLEVNANNHVLNSHVLWEAKLALLATLQPAISTSAFRPGETVRKLWNEFGVVCSGEGVIESGTGGDRGTHARSIKERAGRTNIGSVAEYDRLLSDAIHSPHINGLIRNELVTGGDYSIAGLFINLDDRNYPSKSNSGFTYEGREMILIRNGKRVITKEITLQDIFDTAARWNMDVFAYKGGMAYEATLSDEGKVEIGEAVPPQEMVKRKYILPEEKKPELKALVRESLRNPGAAALLV